MNPNRFALAALGFTCVAAAAGGGYLASRHNAAIQPAAAATSAAAVPAAAPAKAAVPETEAIVGDVKPADVAAPRTSNERPAPARPAAPRPARKAETPPARSTPRSRIDVARQCPVRIPDRAEQQRAADGRRAGAGANREHPGRGRSSAGTSSRSGKAVRGARRHGELRDRTAARRIDLERPRGDRGPRRGAGRA